MRNGFLALLAVVSAGAGHIPVQSYPGNLAFPMLDPPENRPAPAPMTQAAPAPTPMVQAAPASEMDFHATADLVAEPEHWADHVWLGADYLLWWTKKGPLPTPLVTTGSPEADIVGGLTQPGTQILAGRSAVDYGTTNGLRIGAGVWLCEDRSWALEGGAFFLEERGAGFGATSNAHGTPVLAQPLLTPGDGEFTELIALPGFIAGAVSVTTHSRLQGWEVNGVANVCRSDGLCLDMLAGFRTVTLDEDLQVASTFQPLIDGFLNFQTQLVSQPSTLATFDSFQAHNHFYGPQLGGRLEWSLDRLTLGALGKVAVGDSQEQVRVVGSSSLTTPGGAAVPLAGTPVLIPVTATTVVPGGVLALPSNGGDHFRDRFGVVSEMGLQASYQLTRCLEVHAGYTFLYWSEVQRPGTSVDRTVTAGLVPTDPLFGSATGTRPAFQFHSSEYWAHGVNFGLSLRF